LVDEIKGIITCQKCGDIFKLDYKLNDRVSFAHTSGSSRCCECGRKNSNVKGTVIEVNGPNEWVIIWDKPIDCGSTCTLSRSYICHAYDIQIPKKTEFQSKLEKKKTKGVHIGFFKQNLDIARLLGSILKNVCYEVGLIYTHFYKPKEHFFHIYNPKKESVVMEIWFVNVDLYAVYGAESSRFRDTKNLKVVKEW